jgi:flagellar hook-length control protein FliK
MINSNNLANPMLIVGATSAPAKPAQAPARGDNAFEEALAGANAVRDRDTTSPTRGASAAHANERSYNKVDKHENRSRRADAPGQNRDVSQDDDTQAVSADTKTTKPDATTASGDDVTDATAADDTTAAAVADDATEANAAIASDANQQAVAQASAEAQASIVVAAAPVVTVDVQASAAPTDSNALTTSAVDSALKLAIDTAASTATTVDANAATGDAALQTQTQTDASAVAQATDAVLQPTLTTTAAAAAAATNVDDAAALTTVTPTETIAQDSDVVASADALTGPTRPTASSNAPTTAGPTPGQTLQTAATIDATQAAAVTADTDVQVAALTTPVAETVTTAAATTTTQAAVAAEQVVEAGPSAASTVLTAAAASTDVQIDASADAVDTTVTADASLDTAQGAAVKVATGSTSSDADASDSGPHQGSTPAGDAILQPTKPVVTPEAPAITEQLETAVQASQSRAATKEAVAESGAAPTQTVRPLDANSNLLQNLQHGARAEATPNAARMAESVLTQSVQERIDTIAEQLATRLRLSQAAGGTQVQLSLKPRELGDVTVQMQVREGVVAATVLVDRADALNTIGTHIDELRRSLEDQGLSIQQLNVDVRGDWAGSAAGANAQAFADARNGGSNRRQHAAAHSSHAGGLGAIPGLTSDREVDADEVHEGDVSVLI